MVEDPGYLADPAGVVLLPGVPAALARLEALGFLCIIVTNQSGIGRGFFDEPTFLAVQRRVEETLRESGARIDAVYWCPHTPDDGCACRKPGLALYHQAAAAFGIDLAASWWVGDRPSDLAPAMALGGRAILVETGEGSDHAPAAKALGAAVAPDLTWAVERIAGSRRTEIE